MHTSTRHQTTVNVADFVSLHLGRQVMLTWILKNSDLYLENTVIFSPNLEALVINIYFQETFSKSYGKFGGLSSFKSYFWTWNSNSDVYALFKDMVIFITYLEILLINIYFLESFSKSCDTFGGLSNFTSYF